uniref:Uncharacterized protein n=1 Tax=Chromera velia CCMP2878 TaxID=1169474 RepID=A0A0G4FK45_9ALVE|eukprot:Cvel_3428.t1-p1 / transcript=Cvel_3428.t1 / gene=Cvel_3428 / organism=Chromera_velia_CCMP2878 / gene_product=hypothetical protein / transcript_product=hypothetical protein / location=Cvel_scaffold138:19272-20090(+) / protein_length=273 / sequence_SO=supercontig / SO=protein_coding / is_pseudo=false
MEEVMRAMSSARTHSRAGRFLKVAQACTDALETLRLYPDPDEFTEASPSEILATRAEALRAFARKHERDCEATARQALLHTRADCQTVLDGVSAREWAGPGYNVAAEKVKRLRDAVSNLDRELDSLHHHVASHVQQRECAERAAAEAAESLLRDVEKDEKKKKRKLNMKAQERERQMHPEVTAESSSHSSSSSTQVEAQGTSGFSDAEEETRQAEAAAFPDEFSAESWSSEALCVLLRGRELLEHQIVHNARSADDICTSCQEKFGSSLVYYI